jgi:plasmid stabilization system protein ParE
LENRPKAPRAFEEDLAKAFDLMTLLPRTGEPVRHSRIVELRRLLMGRVRYYLYYNVSDETEVVEVLALWHTSRAGRPTVG